MKAKFKVGQVFYMGEEVYGVIYHETTSQICIINQDGEGRILQKAKIIPLMKNPQICGITKNVPESLKPAYKKAKEYRKLIKKFAPIVKKAAVAQ